ncbi:MAG: response regulator [bacterium]
MEDEPGVRELTSKILVENGYTVTEVPDVQEALSVFEKERGEFHLVLSDMVLPDQSGLELVDQLLDRQPKLHILLMSGYPDQKSQWTSIRKRGFRFLQKPYTLSDLLRSVKEELSGQRH